MLNHIIVKRNIGTYIMPVSSNVLQWKKIALYWLIPINIYKVCTFILLKSTKK